MDTEIKGKLDGHGGEGVTEGTNAAGVSEINLTSPMSFFANLSSVSNFSGFDSDELHQTYIDAPIDALDKMNENILNGQNENVVVSEITSSTPNDVSQINIDNLQSHEISQISNDNVQNKCKNIIQNLIESSKVEDTTEPESTEVSNKNKGCTLATSSENNGNEFNIVNFLKVMKNDITCMSDNIQMNFKQNIEGVQQNIRSIEHKIYAVENNLHEILEQNKIENEDNIISILKQNKTDFSDKMQKLVDDVTLTVEVQNNIIKNELQKQNEIIKQQNEMVKTQGKVISSQILTISNVSNQMVSTVTGVETKVDEIIDKVKDFKYDLEVCMMDVLQLKADLWQEIETRETQIKEVKTQVNENKSDLTLLQKQLNDTKVELLAENKNTQIRVSLLKKELDDNVKPLNNELQAMKLELNKLKQVTGEFEIKQISLEGTIAQSTAQGNVLNNHLQNLDDKLANVSRAVPEYVKTALDQVLLEIRANGTRDCNVPPAQISNANHSQIGLTSTTPKGAQDVTNFKQVLENNGIPSISSTPLLPVDFTTPSLPKYDDQPQGVIAKKISKTDHKAIVEIMKTNKRPAFNGANISPPVFLQEVESFLSLVGIYNDSDKLNIFSTFLQDNPSAWWKLVSKQIFTWEMAKEIFLKQYFNEYERQKYKMEWRNLDFNNFLDVERFTLKGLEILNTIKTHDTDQRKCERITVKLPEPLRDYLLNKQFSSTQDYLNQVKEAMLLKNFNANQYVQSKPINLSNQQQHSFNSSGNNLNQNLQNSNQLPINPRYKGNPKNYDPNYYKKYLPQNQQGNHNQQQSTPNQYNSSYNQQSYQTFNNQQGNGSNSNRQWSRGNTHYRGNGRGNNNNRGNNHSNQGGGTPRQGASAMTVATIPQDGNNIIIPPKVSYFLDGISKLIEELAAPPSTSQGATGQTTPTPTN